MARPFLVASVDMSARSVVYRNCYFSHYTINGLHNWPLSETLKKSEYSFYVVLKRSISKEVVR